MEPSRHAAYRTPILVCFLVLLGWPGCAVTQGLQLSPTSVQIGIFFQGIRLTVSADVPEKAQVVLEVIGDVGKEELMRKGKHWDLWMNVEEIDVYGVPYVYYAMSSPSEERRNGGKSDPWGYAGLLRRARFSDRSTGRTAAELFDGFVALKKSKKLYGIFPNALELLPPKHHRRPVRGIFQLPSRLPAGTYRVRLRALLNGRVVEQQHAQFEVSLTGVPALLVHLAYQRAGLYGGLAALVAGAAGLLCGVAFKKREPSPAQKRSL